MDARRFEMLKRQQEKDLDEKARAKGSLDENLRQLREKYGLKDLKAALKEKEGLQRQKADLEKQYETAITELEEKHGGKL